LIEDIDRAGDRASPGNILAIYKLFYMVDIKNIEFSLFIRSLKYPSDKSAWLFAATLVGSETAVDPRGGCFHFKMTFHED